MVRARLLTAEAEKGVNGRGGRQNRFSESPTSPLGCVLARTADGSPEVKEMVSSPTVGFRRVVCLGDISGQAGRAVILDEQRREPLPRRGLEGETVAICHEVGLQPRKPVGIKSKRERFSGQGKRTRTGSSPARASSEFRMVPAPMRWRELPTLHPKKVPLGWARSAAHSGICDQIPIGPFFLRGSENFHRSRTYR